MLLGYFLRVFAILSKRRFFHPLNRNDDLKESESGFRVIGILGVGVGVGILVKLGVGVGVGPYTFRLRNPGPWALLPHPLPAIRLLLMGWPGWGFVCVSTF